MSTVFISFPFSSMKKFALSVASAMLALSLVTPVFAESMMGEHGMRPNKTVDGACMAAAVTKRDTAISAALQLVVTAIQTRGTALAAAWTAMDKNAVKAANDAFKGAWKTFDTTRKAVWATFKTDAKACKPTKGMNVEEPAGPAGL